MIQVPYNLITRGIDEECVSFSVNQNIGMTVYNPVAAGMLTGKYSGVEKPIEGTRFDRSEDYYGRFWHASNFEAVETLTRIAADTGLSLLELALKWLLSQAHVDSIILGSSKPEHLEGNIQVADGRLDEDTMKACDEVWQKLRGPHFKYNR